MEKAYAEALGQAVSRGDSEQKLVEGLLVHLKAVGRLKLLPGILRELRAKQKRQEKLLPTLEVASAEEQAGAVKEAGVTPAQVHVNPTLITGWRMRSGAELIDRSGKQALIDIYRNIVTK